jgi:hypothetical protein
VTPRLRLEERVVLFSNGTASILGFDVFGLGPPLHEQITHQALDSILRPKIVDAIIGNESLNPSKTTGNVGIDVRDVVSDYLPGSSTYDPAHHFDASAFQEGAAFINGLYNQIIGKVTDDSALTSMDPGGVADLFGQVTHVSQDFYAHTNWVETLGAGAPLVDSGDGAWNSLTPYSVVDGVVLVEGTSNPSPSSPINGVVGLSHDANYGALNNPDFLVTVKFANGTTLKGIVSGTYDPALNHVPSAVAVSHDDPKRTIIVTDPFSGVSTVASVRSGTGLNKDRPDRGAGNAAAQALAVEQTKHEFYRLLHLVMDQKGKDAVDKLICDWVLPDQVDAVKQAIGLDTSGDTPAQPKTFDSETPVDISLGDCVHAGDTIVIHATLDSTDPDDNAEGEPLTLKMSGGKAPDGTVVQGQVVTINTYGQQRDITLVAQVDNETLSAYIPGADGDESATVSAEDMANSDNNFDQGENDEIADDSSQTNLDALLVASAAESSGDISPAAIRAAAVSAITITTTATGNVVNVGAPVTTSSATSAGYQVLAALEWRESTALNALTIPQADAKDGTVAAPAPPSFTLSAPGAAAKVVAAFNALYANLGQTIGLADALHVALDRAASAKSAGHAAAEIAQESAARQDASLLVALLGQQPGLRTQLQGALKAAGVSQTVSQFQVESFEENVAFGGGLPATITKALQLSGADSPTIAAIKTLAIVQDASTVAGTLPDKLTGPGLATSLPKAAAAIQAIAAPDLTVNVTQFSASIVQGSATPSIALGSPVYYGITVTNKGALAISGAALNSVFDPALSGVSWVATAFGNAQAPASGTGDIHASLSLPAGSSVTFAVTATLSAQPTGALVETSTVGLPTGLTDAHPADNTATAKLQVVGNPALKPLQVDAIAAQSVKAGSLLTLRPHVFDPNSAAGQIRFSLDPGAPVGAKIDPQTGVFTYTPAAGTATATVTIRATAFGLSSLSAASTFHINVTSNASAAPAVTLSAPGSAVVYSSFAGFGSFTSTAAGSFVAAADYGDGTGLQLLAIGTSQTFTLAHTYVRAGTYVVTVGVTDSTGAVGRSTRTVTVSPSPPSGFGAGRDAFVTALYLEDLGRSPEPAGLAFWSRSLAAGVKPRTVALAIYLSPEHRLRVAQGLVAPVGFLTSYNDALRAGQLAAASLTLPAGPLALT